MTNKQAAAALRSAASALEHGRCSTAISKVRQVFIHLCRTEDAERVRRIGRVLDAIHEQYVHDSKLPD